MTDIPTLEGFSCRLRPVKVEDAAFIVRLRNQPFARGTIHPTSLSVDKQIDWIKTWEKRERDYYWIIESYGEQFEPIGTIGFYDIEPDLKEGMPGRWVMMPQGKVSIIAPFFLMYQFVFEKLDIDRFVMDVVASNKKVRRFHELYGAKYIDPPARYANIADEVGAPLVWFEFTRKQWPSMQEYWKPILEAY